MIKFDWIIIIKIKKCIIKLINFVYSVFYHNNIILFIEFFIFF